MIINPNQKLWIVSDLKSQFTPTTFADVTVITSTDTVTSFSSERIKIYVDQLQSG